MNLINFLGLAAGFLVMISLIPQVVKAWKMKETRDISLGMCVMLVVSNGLWLIYGIFINSLPITGWNIAAFILNSIILFFKLKYK